VHCEKFTRKKSKSIGAAQDLLRNYFKGHCELSAKHEKTIPLGSNIRTRRDVKKIGRNKKLRGPAVKRWRTKGRGKTNQLGVTLNLGETRKKRILIAKEM